MESETKVSTTVESSEYTEQNTKAPIDVSAIYPDIPRTSNQTEIVTPPKRTNEWVIVAPLLFIYTGITIILSVMGSSSEEYAYVQNLTNISQTLGWILALVAGAAFATSMYQKTSYTGDGTVQMRPSYTPTICAALVVLGLFLGFLPGVILFVIFMSKGNFKHKMVIKVEETEAEFKSKRMISILLTTAFAFVSGFIGILIYAMLISYPLSKKACELSSAKYC